MISTFNDLASYASKYTYVYQLLPCITVFKVTRVIYNELKKTSFDVGIHFGNFREYSVKFGDNNKLCMLSGKTSVAFR